jgi:hypothetical protein
MKEAEMKSIAQDIASDAKEKGGSGGGAWRPDAICKVCSAGTDCTVDPTHPLDPMHHCR